MDEAVPLKFQSGETYFIFRAGKSELYLMRFKILKTTLQNEADFINCALRVQIPLINNA